MKENKLYELLLDIISEMKRQVVPARAFLQTIEDGRYVMRRELA